MPGLGGAQLEKKSIKATLVGVGTNAVFLLYYGKVYIYEHLTDELAWIAPVCPLSQVGRELFSLTNTKVADYIAAEEFALATKPANSSKLSVFDTFEIGGNVLPVGTPKILFQAS